MEGTLVICGGYLVLQSKWGKALNVRSNIAFWRANSKSPAEMVVMTYVIVNKGNDTVRSKFNIHKDV